MDAGVDFDSGGRLLACGNPVNPYLGAGWCRFDLRPGHVAVFLMKCGIEFRLAIVADLHRTGVSFITQKTQNHVVFTGR
jgi:hypothetical protein